MILTIRQAFSSSTAFLKGIGEELKKKETWEKIGRIALKSLKYTAVAVGITFAAVILTAVAFLCSAALFGLFLLGLLVFAIFMSCAKPMCCMLS